TGGPGGPPGTQGNQPQGTTAATTAAVGAGNQQFNRTTELTNYEVSKVVRHRVDPYGTVKKLSAAVIVDDQMKKDKDKKGVEQIVFAPRTAEDLKKFRDLVAAAVGIDAARGDQLTVENLAFGVRQEMVEGVESPSFLTQYSGYILPAVKYAAFLLLFLLVYMMVLKPMGTRVYTDVVAKLESGAGHGLMLPSGGAGAHAAGQLPRTVGDIEAELENEIESELPTLSKEMRKGGVIKKKVAEAVKKEPTAASNMVKTWIAEDRHARRRV
ncbi:MAG: hypothetical protein HYX75_11505, partial [Acidobacteria bacterium]|nr:hypothetical protein [Acidobacteriota bacterium]